MPDPAVIDRPLGTMIAYGFPRGDVAIDLAIAARIGASHLEILPDWRSSPDPGTLRKRVEDSPFRIWSAHGGWGGQAIRASRIDLGSPEESIHSGSVDDLKLCLDWLREAGGTHLVVHPGGLSDPADRAARRDRLVRGLLALADHAGGSGLVICVENMPPGVHPGSRSEDLASIIAEVDRPGVRLALDTGHANIVSSAAEETVAMGAFLATTHVHDNNGRSDTHQPPGLGTADWDAWVAALDRVDYRGPVILECIRYLRERPGSIDSSLLERLRRLARRGAGERRPG